MKNLIYIFALMLLFTSCNKENDSVPEIFRLGTEEDFSLGDENHSDDNQLKFRITEINDSRCPSDVVCVWEGMVVVKITVDSPVQGSLSLNSYNNKADTLGQYSFRLIEVSPYPVSTEEIKLEDYDVTLKIEEL